MFKCHYFKYYHEMTLFVGVSGMILRKSSPTGFKLRNWSIFLDLEKVEHKISGEAFKQENVYMTWRFLAYTHAHSNEW